jgi:acyl carrier protein
MEKTEVIYKLTMIFRKVLSSDILELTNEMTANDVEKWDSLSHMMLIAEIEKEFSIKFKLKELNKIRNVGDLIDVIYFKLEK